MHQDAPVGIATTPLIAPMFTGCHDGGLLVSMRGPGLSVRYGPEVILAAKLGLVPLGLGGVLGHHRLVEPLLDIAAEAVRGQVGEVEGCTAMAAKTFMARPLRWIYAISAPSA